MAKRMSSRERLERLAAEKDASDLEKAEARKVTARKAAAPRKRTVAAPKREKTVWNVYNAGYKVLASYAYPDRAKAEAHATRLTQSSGTTHFVNSAKVPMGEAE